MNIDDLMAPMLVGGKMIARFGIRQSHLPPYRYVAFAYWLDGTVDRTASPRATVAMATIRKLAEDKIKQKTAEGSLFENKIILLRK